jgi:3-oxoadipate enol-lactonase
MTAPIDLHFEARGPADGTPLILAASMGTDLSLWDPQMAELAGTRRVVRYDARGHGRSPVPEGPYTLADLGEDMVGLMDRLGIERADVCGTSIGGMAAMWTASHAPERIGRLILICTSARPDRAAYARRAALVRAEGLAPVADAVVNRWITPDFAARHPERVAALRAMLLATPAEGYAGSCDALAAMDLEADLPRIGAPTLIVAAAHDLALPPVHSEHLASVIPASRMVTVPAAAHLANVEQPAAVTALIVEHLAAGPMEVAR